MYYLVQTPLLWSVGDLFCTNDFNLSLYTHAHNCILKQYRRPQNQRFVRPPTSNCTFFWICIETFPVVLYLNNRHISVSEVGVGSEVADTHISPSQQYTSVHSKADSDRSCVFDVRGPCHLKQHYEMLLTGHYFD